MHCNVLLVAVVLLLPLYTSTRSPYGFALTVQIARLSSSVSRAPPGTFPGYVFSGKRLFGLANLVRSARISKSWLHLSGWRPTPPALRPSSTRPLLPPIRPPPPPMTRRTPLSTNILRRRSSPHRILPILRRTGQVSTRLTVGR